MSSSLKASQSGGAIGSWLKICVSAWKSDPLRQGISIRDPGPPGCGQPIVDGRPRSAAGEERGRADPRANDADPRSAAVGRSGSCLVIPSTRLTSCRWWKWSAGQRPRRSRLTVPPTSSWRWHRCRAWRPPEPFDEDFVHPAAAAVHRRSRRRLWRAGRLGGRGELRALVGVENLRPAELRQRLLESRQTRTKRPSCSTAATQAPRATPSRRSARDRESGVPIGM